MDNVPLSLEYSADALQEFLDFLADKGLVKRNTVVSRKAACNKMFSILDAGDAADLRDVDIDDLASRFNNLRGTKYSPQSLQVYKSRVATSLSDFFRYKENPANFRVSSSGNGRGKNVKARPKNAASNANSAAAPKINANDEGSRGISTINIPVPIRKNVVVQVNGLPVDLTADEAKKIAAVVQAMSSIYDG